MSKMLKYAAIVAAIILVYIFLIPKGCKSDNPIVDGPRKDQPVTEIPINDSQTIAKQIIDIVENEKKLLRDSFVNVMIKNGKLDPKVVIQYQERIVADPRTVILETSINSYIDSINRITNQLALKENLSSAQIASLETAKKELLAKRIPFRDSSKYRLLSGDFGLDSRLNINEDVVISKPTVVLGTKKRFLNIGEPTYTLLLGNENPAIQRSEISSVMLKQPKPKLEVSLGPIALANKEQFTLGAGINIKRGFLSVTAGYQLYNQKLK